MKRLFSFCLLFLLSGCSQEERMLDRLTGGHEIESSRLTLRPVPRPPRQLVIGIAGQSLSHFTEDDNSVNVSQTGHVTINQNYLDWHSFFVPTKAHPADYGTTMIRLGDLIYLKTHRPVLMVFSSVGATSSYSWKNDLYYRTIASFQDNNLKPDMILWTQGESDSQTPEEDYLLNMRVMVAHWRQWGLTCPVYMALTSNPNVHFPSGTRLAQEQLIAEGLFLRGPDIDEMRHNASWFLSDDIHPNHAGCFELAKRWLEVITIL